MVTFAAIALPIVLAVMGLFVTVKPPQEKWRWALFVAFIIVGLLAIGGGIRDRWNADAAQQQLQGSIKGLEDAVRQLTKPVEKQAIPKGRDPDTLYQNESSVGNAIGARITLSESKTYFDEIENAGNLDRSKPFEYRDYVLRFVSADSYIGMLVSPGRVANNVYRHVVCEIIGRVH